METYAEYEEVSTSPVARREVPAPRTVLIVELAAPLLAAGAGDGDTIMHPARAFLGVPGRGPASTWHAGAQHCGEVRLTQLGVYRLFGSMTDLGGCIVALDALWGSPAPSAGSPSATTIKEHASVSTNRADPLDGLDDTFVGGLLTILHPYSV